MVTDTIQPGLLNWPPEPVSQFPALLMVVLPAHIDAPVPPTPHVVIVNLVESMLCGVMLLMNAVTSAFVVGPAVPEAEFPVRQLPPVVLSFAHVKPLTLAYRVASFATWSR